jgi:hypothetical protein
VATPDYETIDRFRQMGREAPDVWILTFEEFLKGEFPQIIKNMLKVLQQAYSYPVDTEFAVNFDNHGKIHINLLQCRPLQTNRDDDSHVFTIDFHENDLLFSTCRNTMGGSLQRKVERLIYVEPAAYSELIINDKYQVARLVGHLNRMFKEQNRVPFMLIGPGRWGSSTPSLGVPVSFAEICNASVLAEVAQEENGFMPELSFGTHFFQDLVETKIFYVALFPGREDVVFNAAILKELDNEFVNYLPDYAEWQKVIKVFDLSKTGKELWLESDIKVRRQCVSFIEHSILSGCFGSGYPNDNKTTGSS